MKSKSLAALQRKLADTEEQLRFYKSLVGAFYEGEVQGCASMQHFIFAKWGRKRLEELKQVPALLR